MSASPTPKPIDPALIELYDLLMAEIEPELMSNSIPELGTWYEGETPDERRVRLERYAKALETFNGRFGELVDLWKQAIVRYQEGRAGDAWSEDDIMPPPFLSLPAQAA